MHSGRNRILHHLGNHIQQFLLVIVDYKFDELKNMTKLRFICNQIKINTYEKTGTCNPSHIMREAVNLLLRNQNA